MEKYKGTQKKKKAQPCSMLAVETQASLHMS